MDKIIHASGKRKKATARATLRPGKGKVKINGTMLDVYEPRLYRLRIMEPVILSAEVGAGVDIDVTIEGGGYAGHADAARLAIGKVLSIHSPKLRKVFLDYDRTLLVADVRRKEAAKPNRHGQARARRQKSYR